ncbi:hypothetical protein [Hydrogenophaga sp.]|uniref:hypothetical protein n=1 Tax=Hydrogenophaga sp. TaxID=1904254 RepID=UPI003D132A32
MGEALSQIQTFASSKDVSHLTAFREKMHEFANKVETTPSSFLLPSVLALHHNLHVDEFVGERLAQRIRGTMAAPGMLPEEVVDAVNKLRTEFSAVATQVSEISSRMRERGVELTSLDASDAEFGIAFSPDLVGATAKDLLFEVGHLNRLFMCTNELLGRGTESPRIRTIAASWWQFFFELDAAQVALWTVALERIIQLIKSGYEIKKIKQDLESKQDLIPTNFIPELEEKILTLFKTGVAQLAVELKESCQYQGEQGRGNELEVQLKQELLHLVRRVNGGAVLEIRLGLPNSPQDHPEETEAESPEGLLRSEQVERIAAVTQLNAKLASLSNVTAQLEMREDLLLEAPVDEAESPEASSS